MVDKWLAVRLSALGDVALTTGVLRHWQETRGWRFAFLTRAEYAPLLQGHPAVDEIVVPPDSALRGLGWPGEAVRLARRFRGWGLMDLHGSLRSRLLSLAWRGPVRRYVRLGLDRRLHLHVGLSSARQRLAEANVPQRYSLAVDSELPPRSALLPAIHLTDPELDAAGKRLASILDADRPVAALHPYATHPDKAWPAGHWVELARLLSEAGWDWFVVGKSDRLPGLDPARDLTGATDLRATCGLLARADVLVTGDSGPMHLAGGVGTPVVALFGPTDRAWGFYPAGESDVVLELDMDCRPCSLHGKRKCPRSQECLAGIEPGRVLEAVRRATGK